MAEAVADDVDLGVQDLAHGAVPAKRPRWVVIADVEVGHHSLDGVFEMSQVGVSIVNVEVVEVGEASVLVLPRSLDPERRVADEFAAVLKGVPVGSPLRVGALPAEWSSDLSSSLHFLISEILERSYAEWEDEALDGFFLASAVKTDEVSAEFAGTCVLRTDRTVTPFALNLSLERRLDRERKPRRSPSRRAELMPAYPPAVRSLRIRLGEPGDGELGVSRPDRRSGAAENMLLALSARLEQVDWVYDVTVVRDSLGGSSRRSGAVADRTASGATLLPLRRVHATSQDQMELVAQWTARGWFDLEDVAFDAEAACVVVPFRAEDRGVVVETPRTGEVYAAWRRWLLLIRCAVGLEISGPGEETGPHDFLTVDFDPDSSKVEVHTDGTWISVSVRVERIDVVVEETCERVGWGRVNPSESGVVLPEPPPGSRRIATLSWR